MCCFSVWSPGSLIVRLLFPPIKVSATGIFARFVEPGVQGLAYSMNLVAKEPVAMILPLPVVPGSGDDAVTFVDLEKHPNMFEELHLTFQPPMRKSRGIRLGGGFKQLTVHKIGSFEASYVPTRADFTRLDQRFRMPDAAFDALPQYADYGFAVFQLAPGKKTVHPMGMKFPSRDPKQLYFPTVHVHDGVVHAKAKFDHMLYYQGKKPEEYERDRIAFMSPWHDYGGLADRMAPLQRRILRGRLKNEDTWVDLQH